MGKLINRIPGSCLLISSLPGSASRTHVESLSKPRNSTSIPEALPGNFISKDTHLVFSICFQMCLIASQVILKPACSATKTSQNLETSHFLASYSFQRTNNKGTDQTAQMCRLVCAFEIHIQHN